MADIHTIEGDFTPGEGRFALIVSRFNAFVVESLVAGALDALRRHGVPDARITIIRTPGAWELPLVAQKAALSGNYDAIVALGAVIRVAPPTSSMWQVNAPKALPPRPWTQVFRWRSVC